MPKRLLNVAREYVRPCYLRWLYFPLFPERRPRQFQDCWRFPVQDPAAMPRTRLPDIVFYPMTDWHARLQRSQHLARAFARLGHRCIYLNPNLGRQFEQTFGRSPRLLRLEENVYEFHVRLPREPVFHHRLLHPEETRSLSSAMDGLLRSMGSTSALQIVSLPVWFETARATGHTIIYDCHDHLGGFANMAREIVDAEEAAIQGSDLALFSSQNLLDRFGAPEHGLLSRNAVDFAHFQTGKRLEGAPLTAGYVGALERWFDIAALREAARLNPQCRFLLAGRIDYPTIRELDALPNVEFLGEVPYAQLPELFERFHIGLIPFQTDELTRATNPIKLYEYFSCGLPVASARLPEVEAFSDLVYPASTPAEFAAAVQSALQESDPAKRARRIEIAKRESWTARAVAIIAALNRSTPRKPSAFHPPRPHSPR